MTTTFIGQELPELLRDGTVPVWMPWPLPAGWLVTGFAGAVDDRTGSRASAVALSGPNPFGGPGEMLIISEEPGVGLGASFAGLSGLDPGSDVAASPPHAFVRLGNRQFPLWHVDAPHRAAYVGAVMGHWIWLVLFPDTVGLLMAEPLALRDLRDPGQELNLPYGERSPLLPG